MQEDSSLTSRAYFRLRADLITCRLLPGSHLNVSRLQRELGFSQAAVREALSRLTSEGLVEVERHSGFRAAPTSMTGFRELTTACATIELPCLRSAIKNGDVVWEGKLLATYHVASRMLQSVVRGEQDLIEYVGHRQAFHETLLAPCDNQWLLWSWRLLYAQYARYRHTFASLARFESELDSDFRDFMDVVLKRDIESAERLCLENYEKIAQFVESSFAKLEASAARASRKPKRAQPA
jgi:GntR family transcriptional regulator, carbon starvation induced regulator